MFESKFYRDYILNKNKTLLMIELGFETFLNTISNKYFELNKFYFFYSLLLKLKTIGNTVMYI